MSCIFHIIDLVKLSCPGMEYVPPRIAHLILFIMWSTMTCATDILKSIFLKADTFGQIKYNMGNNNKPTHLGMVLYHLFMMIWGMVYYCFTHITVGRIFVRQRLAWHGVQRPGKQWLFPKTCVPWCLDCVSYRYGHIYTYIYMVIDLKVLVKSFNCEDRSCYAGNPRESFFCQCWNGFWKYMVENGFTHLQYI